MMQNELILERAKNLSLANTFVKDLTSLFVVISLSLSLSLSLSDSRYLKAYPTLGSPDSSQISQRGQH